MVLRWNTLSKFTFSLLLSEISILLFLRHTIANCAEQAIFYLCVCREAYRRLQQDGKIGGQPDRAYLFSRGSMVVSDCSDADLFDDPEGLEALLAEPTTIMSKRCRADDAENNEEGNEDTSRSIHDYDYTSNTGGSGDNADEAEDV